jgi:hypothetical protein
VKLPRESTDPTVSRIWNGVIMWTFSLSTINLPAISRSSACGSDSTFERTTLLIDYRINELVIYFVKWVRKGESCEKCLRSEAMIQEQSNDRNLLTCSVRGHGIKVDLYFGSSQE